MKTIQITILFLLLSAAASAQEQSHIDAASELLRLSNADAIINQSYDMVQVQMSQVASQLNITDEQRPIFDRYMQGVMQVMREEFSWEKVEPHLIRIYTAVYTEEELRELNEFYASPLGQKFVAKMPDLMNETMAMTNTLMQSMMPRMTELQQQMIEDLQQGAGQ